SLPWKDGRQLGGRAPVAAPGQSLPPARRPAEESPALSRWKDTLPRCPESGPPKRTRSSSSATRRHDHAARWCARHGGTGSLSGGFALPQRLRRHRSPPSPRGRRHDLAGLARTQPSRAEGPNGSLCVSVSWRMIIFCCTRGSTCPTSQPSHLARITVLSMPFFTRKIVNEWQRATQDV